MKKNLLALFALISLFTITPCYSEKKTGNKLSVEHAVEIYNNGDKEQAKVDRLLEENENGQNEMTLRGNRNE